MVTAYFKIELCEDLKVYDQKYFLGKYSTISHVRKAAEEVVGSPLQVRTLRRSLAGGRRSYLVLKNMVVISRAKRPAPYPYRPLYVGIISIITLSFL